jgi:hypothetical protein
MSGAIRQEMEQSSQSIAANQRLLLLYGSAFSEGKEL